MAAPATQVAIPLNNGATMHQLGFGTWQAPAGEVARAVELAIKHGFRHIDGAAVYRNEVEVGDAIAKCVSEGIVKREDLFVTTKLWCHNHHPSEVRAACQASLKRLKLEYLDLYLIHWPASFENNAKDADDISSPALFPSDDEGKMKIRPIPVADTWKAMEELVDAKLTRAIGVSNFRLSELREVTSSARIQPAAHQIECHPCLPQTELREEQAKHKIVTQAYCPLGIGMGDMSRSLLKHPKIAEIAKKHGLGEAEMLLRWNLTVGNVTLSKSVTEARIAENAATSSEPLPATVMTELAEFGAANPLRVCNPGLMFGPKGTFDDDFPNAF